MNSAPKKPIHTRFNHRERKALLLIGDIFFTLIAMAIALITWAKGDDWLGLSPEFFAERPDSWFYLLPILWMALMIPIYDARRAHSRKSTLRGIAIASAICLGAYLLIFFISPPNALPRRGVAVFFVVVAILFVFWRLLYIRKFTMPGAMINTVIVGAGKAGARIGEIIHSIDPLPYNVVGYIDDDEEKQGAIINGYPVIGNSSQFFDLINEHRITLVIMAISHRLEPTLFEALTMTEERGLQVSAMPRIYEELLGRVPVFLLESDWMLRTFYDDAHAGAFFELIKRMIDILGGLFGIILMIPLFPFIAAAIMLDSGLPIFYYQERLGLRGEPFSIIKFRTMVQNAEKDGVARPASENDERVTRAGRFLRRSHLDEIPQFINVLRGDLSLVGPRAERPEIIRYLQKGIPFYRGRLLVRPGITGWAQVNYGYASGTEQNAVKLEYDLYYIKHRSLAMDISILLKTVKTIIGLKGR